MQNVQRGAIDFRNYSNNYLLKARVNNSSRQRIVENSCCSRASRQAAGALERGLRQLTL